MLPHRLRPSAIAAALLGVALISMLEPYLRPRLDQLDLDDIAGCFCRAASA